MDYTSIHIYGHLLSDDILHGIEMDPEANGNREKDYGLDVRLSAKIDNAWSSLRNDWNLFASRDTRRDLYGTTSVRRLMVRFFSSLDYQLELQSSQIEVGEQKFDIPYLCPELDRMPIIIVGDRTGNVESDALDKCTLDIRVKGERRQKSPHATMIEYLNSTEHTYGIITNGHVLRLIRNTGQLVKLTYIEFDLRRMVEEDHYNEFRLLFRLLHSSRFVHSGNDACIFEQWFNSSVESGNRIRDGLSDAVRKAMETLGKAVVCSDEKGSKEFRQAVIDGTADARILNKELIHLIYRLLFLFIIEDRNLVYDIGESGKDEDYERKIRCQEIYKKYYSVSRLRKLSELRHLYDPNYYDIWNGLKDSFRLFEDEAFGAPLCIKPLGGILFAPDTLKYMNQCRITNEQLLTAIACLNEFRDEKHNLVKISYSSLDVEEFGSVYEGILEMRAIITRGHDSSPAGWNFTFGAGQDRKSTSSYYTRPDIVQSLIRTTLEPVIKERIAKQPTTEAKIKDLLSMKLCDAASGSGHIVLAMARTLAWYICTLRTGEDNPASQEYRKTLREVIQKCVYAVDCNPDAVELCKVVLWIEGYCSGKPLSFLDHHIRCGNSVVGVTDLNALLDGVPNDAFSSTDKETLKLIKAINKRALKEVDNLKSQKEVGGSGDMFAGQLNIKAIDDEHISLAADVERINDMPENSLLEELTKQKRWSDLMVSPKVECLRRACDIYTYAFFKQFDKNEIDTEGDDSFDNVYQIPYTRTVFQALQEIQYLNDQTGEEKTLLTKEFKDEATDAARHNNFFHWCVEFPEVFADGGFDVMCGNPPWDKIKVEDKKWFEKEGRIDIVDAGTAAQRKQMISGLQTSDPILYSKYRTALAYADATSHFVRESGRFPLTAKGDIDLYPLFAEHCFRCVKEAWGLVIPTGIATNDTTQDFLAKLITENRLISLYDFENRENLFDIDCRYRFCLLTAGQKQDEPRIVSVGFFLTRMDHLLDPNRINTLQRSDFEKFNPNTKTSPLFRTDHDVKLTSRIYNTSTILVKDDPEENPWDVRFGSMIHMSSDSHLFKTYKELTNEKTILKGNHFLCQSKEYIPLYEGKMFYIYNHHYGNWPTEGKRPTNLMSTEIQELENPDSTIIPWYWVAQDDAIEKLHKSTSKKKNIQPWNHKWLIGFRDITNATNERTFIVSVIPDAVGVGNNATLLFAECGVMPAVFLLAMMSSIAFDYAVRQKIGGSHASITFAKQFPVLTPTQIPEWSKPIIIERVAELCYFNHDLDGWMDELWHDKEMTDDIRRRMLARLKECNGLNINLDHSSSPDFKAMQPYIYNEDRRAVAQAELDALFAYLYGLNTDDLRYILDPEDIYGEGCIHETFRVLKNNEISRFGEYRTKRLVLDAWHRFGFDS